MKAALNEIPLPKYIAIEGPIGVGKTTLANKIAETFNYDAFLEQPAENPFLKNFYKNPSQSALATQLFFLFQRMQQIQDLKQRSLFENNNNCVKTRFPLREIICCFKAGQGIHFVVE